MLFGGVLLLATAVVASVSRRHGSIRDHARIGLAIAMAVAGVAHLVQPDPFVQHLPEWVPGREALVAVTGVVDRLERAGYARRTADPRDRRKVKVEVTPAFYERAEEIWAPLKREWDEVLARRFTARELEDVITFLRATNDLARRHVERLRSAT